MSQTAEQQQGNILDSVFGNGTRQPDNNGRDAFSMAVNAGFICAATGAIANGVSEMSTLMSGTLDNLTGAANQLTPNANLNMENLPSLSMSGAG